MKQSNLCEKASVPKFYAFSAIPEVRLTPDDELRQMKYEAQSLKLEIMRERRRNELTTKTSSTTNKKEEKFRKKLAEVEAQIVLATPDLSLRIYDARGKVNKYQSY